MTAANMSRPSHHLPGAPLEAEGGFALITVLLFLVVLSTLLLAVLTTVEGQLTGGAQTTASVQATASADAGISAAYAGIIQATSYASLPCSAKGDLPQQTGQLAAGYSYKIIYYSAIAVPPEGSDELTCSQVQSGTASVAGAKITSTGTAGTGSRAFEQVIDAIVAIQSSFSSSLSGYSIFSGSDFTVSSNAKIIASGNEMPTIYVDGNFTCSANADIIGNVVATGTVNLASNCTIHGNVESTLASISTSPAITISANAAVTGNVSDPQGWISLATNAQILGNVSAAGLLSSGLIKGVEKIFTSVVPSSPSFSDGTPQAVALPALTLNASAWESAGYSLVSVSPTPPASCADIVSELQMAASSGRVVFETTCPIQLGSNTTVTLSHSLAIFASGGIQVSSNAGFESSGGSHKLYLIVPSGSPGAGLSTCVTASVSLSANASISSAITTFIYTPGDASLSSNASITGSVMAGGICQSSNAPITYAPIGNVPGLTMPNGPDQSYSFSITPLDRYTVGS